MVVSQTCTRSFAELLNHRLHGNHNLVKGLNASFLEGENPKAGILCDLVNLESNSDYAVLLLLLLRLIGCLRYWIQGRCCRLRRTAWASW
jgi:hypothetical protein